MKNTDFLNEDLEKFAEHMGFDGIDSDLFYESYYKMTREKTDEEYELYWEMYTERSY